MEKIYRKKFKLKQLPFKCEPDSIYYIRETPTSKVFVYVTDNIGIPSELKDEAGSGGIQNIQNTDGNLIISGSSTKNIDLQASFVSTVNSALQPNDNISNLNNDVGYITNFTETDPIFQASEASLFVAGDKTNLDNQSGVNSGDETTSSIQAKRPLKTVNGESLEGIGDVQIDYNDLSNTPTTFTPSIHTHSINDIINLQDNLNNKVPYTGATQNVDLGEYQIKTGQLELDQTPTQTFGVGKIRWNDSAGTAEIRLKGNNVTLQIGQELVKRVVNKTATNINLLESNYQVVKIVGAQGQRLAIDLAQANNDLNSATTLGVVTENINNNQEGFITYSGEVNIINTTGSLQGETWNDGDVLYLSPTIPGNITNIKPTAPNHVVTIGYVEYAHSINGKIFVKIDNGYELEELHNVVDTNYITPIPSDSFLIFDSISSLWKKLSLSSLKNYFDSIYTTSTLVASQITSALTGYATQSWVTSQNYITNVISNLGYTPEDVAKKATNFSTINDNLYPTVKAVNDQLSLKQDILNIISSTEEFNFNFEQDIVVKTINNTQITNSNFKSFTYQPQETVETSLDDFSLNGVTFSIENIVDNTSFDIRATAFNNASGNYTIKYTIII